MGAGLPRRRYDVCMRERFPFASRRKAVKVLVRATSKSRRAGTHDAAQINQRLLIDLFKKQKLRVIAEVAQKPAKTPKGALAAVNSSRKRSIAIRFGLKNPEPDRQERLLRMAPVGSP